MTEGVITPEDVAVIEDDAAVSQTKAQKIKAAAVEKAQRVKDAAAARAQQLKSAAGEKYTQGKDKAKQVHTNAEEYVRAHPTKCVLGALGLGVVIGLMVRR